MDTQTWLASGWKVLIGQGEQTRLLVSVGSVDTYVPGLPFEKERV
jgi:hypothetical protein